MVRLGSRLPMGAQSRRTMEAELRGTTDLWGKLAYGRWYVQEQPRDNEMPPTLRPPAWRKRPGTHAPPT